jgi:hypothetical protein
MLMMSCYIWRQTDLNSQNDDVIPLLGWRMNKLLSIWYVEECMHADQQLPEGSTLRFSLHTSPGQVSQAGVESLELCT